MVPREALRQVGDEENESCTSRGSSLYDPDNAGSGLGEGVLSGKNLDFIFSMVANHANTTFIFNITSCMKVPLANIIHDNIVDNIKDNRRNIVMHQGFGQESVPYHSL